MKTALFLGTIGIVLTGHYASADQTPADQLANQEDTKPMQFEKLGLVNSQSVRMSNEEADAANRQAVENIAAQVEMSDPETKAALLKAQRKLQNSNAEEPTPDSNQ